MRAGDEIVAIDGRRDISYKTLLLKVALSGQGQVLHFDVKRPGQRAADRDGHPAAAGGQQPTVRPSASSRSESLAIGDFLPPPA